MSLLCTIACFTHVSILYFAGMASTYPEPKNKESFIQDQLYDYDYDKVSAIPKTWDWPTVQRP